MSDWNKIYDWVEEKSSDVARPVRKVLSAPPVDPPKFPGNPQLDKWPKWKAPKPWFEDKQVKDFAVDTGLKYVQMQVGLSKFGMDMAMEAMNPFKKLEYLSQLEQDWNKGYYIRSFLGMASLIFLGNATIPVSIYDSFIPFQNPTRDGIDASFPSYGDWNSPGSGEQIAGLLGFRDHYQNVYKDMKTAYNWTESKMFGRPKSKGGRKKSEQWFYEQRKRASERNPWNP